MRLSRRRFISISAGAALSPRLAVALPVVWQGSALGAAVSITLRGSGQSALALAAAQDAIRRVERAFSLYRADSELALLNRKERLRMSIDFARLVELSDRAVTLTGGLFDPSIQPLWLARAAGLKEDLSDRVGWQHVRRGRGEVSFARPGMALTFNGIAQGYASARVRDALHAHGFEDVVVDIGEFSVGSEPARLAVVNEAGRILAEVGVKDGAVATSSPGALRLAGGGGHILNPDGSTREPSWRTVSVVGVDAAMADALSTGLCLAPDARLAEELVANGNLTGVLLENLRGDVTRIGLI